MSYKKSEVGVDVTTLGNVIDTTWGRSSTKSVASHSVKARLGSNVDGVVQLIVDYRTVVKFTSNAEKFALQRRYVEESDMLIGDELKRISRDYKDSVGSSLKFEPVTSDFTWQYISSNPYNTLQSSYFVRYSTFNVV